MAIVYRKTAKGQSEIETRAHRLPPRTRSVLIMVDGRRTDADLAALTGPEAAAALAALAANGFIEALEATPPPAPPPPPPAPAAAAATRVVPFEQFRRETVRALTDAIGPLGEALAMRMERCRNADELTPLLQLAMESIANTRGRQAAAAYGARFGLDGG